MRNERAERGKRDIPQPLLQPRERPWQPEHHVEQYASQLARCLKALDLTAPIRMRVQDEPAAVRAGQGTRAAASTPADPRRQHDASGLTAGELERTRRELATSLALTRPDSPARMPIQAQLAAIDAERDARSARAHHG